MNEVSVTVKTRNSFPYTESHPTRFKDKLCSYVLIVLTKNIYNFILFGILFQTK